MVYTFGLFLIEATQRIQFKKQKVIAFDGRGRSVGYGRQSLRRSSVEQVSLCSIIVRARNNPIALEISVNSFGAH